MAASIKVNNVDNLGAFDFNIKVNKAYEEEKDLLRPQNSDEHMIMKQTEAPGEGLEDTKAADRIQMNFDFGPNNNVGGTTGK